MYYKSYRNLTAFLLIATPILFMTAFTLLQINFEYPDILRRPAAYVMEQFVAEGSGLIAKWSLLIAISMFKSSNFKAWVGWTGIASGIGILVGILEPAGVPFAGLINAMAYIVWAIWIVVVGVFILRVKVEK